MYSFLTVPHRLISSILNNGDREKGRKSQMCICCVAEEYSLAQREKCCETTASFLLNSIFAKD